MGINAISWRRILTLNERLGERFVHVYTYSHHKHWLWTGIRIDGSSATIDTRTLAVEENPPTDAGSTQWLLRDRSRVTEHNREWLRELDERAAQLGPEGSTVVQWALEFFVNIALVEDEPVLKMALTHYLERGREQAAAGGYGLLGEPEITHEPAAWVETENGPLMVDMGLALLSGVTEPTAHRYRIIWRAVRKAMGA